MSDRQTHLDLAPWPPGARLPAAVKIHSADIRGSTAVRIWPTSVPLAGVITSASRRQDQIQKGLTRHWGGRPPELTKQLDVILILD